MTHLGRLVAAGCVAAAEELAEMVAVSPDEATLDAWVGRRVLGEPLAWIVGSVNFAGRRIVVDPGVYVPRAQSEGLARRVVLRLATRGRLVDLCTGSGAIAAVVAAERPDATVIGVDVDGRAVVSAARNGVSVVLGDLGAPLRRKAFDVVRAVAPYVPTEAMRYLPSDVQRYEPRLALDGGHDGLRLLRGVAAAAADLLRPGGWLLLELGGDQDRAVSPMLDRAGFGSIGSWYDDEGDVRGVEAVRTGR